MLIGCLEQNTLLSEWLIDLSKNLNEEMRIDSFSSINVLKSFKHQLDLILISKDFKNDAQTWEELYQSQLYLLDKTPLMIIGDALSPVEANEILQKTSIKGFIKSSMSKKATYHALAIVKEGYKFIPNELLINENESNVRETQQAYVFGYNWNETRIKYNLTNKEIEVLQDLAEGAKNKEIANKLGVTEITIKKHASEIYKKMGVRNKTEARNKIVS